ncbi:MAG TPA: ATP-binding protein [Casimicrobiaceae bacterium]|nr:ATP-binding protein [Casimicrobiaceae bacterium]
MPPREQAVFPARFAALPETAAFAGAFCERNGVGRDDALRLRLVIEELFTNTIEHGLGGESDSPIRLALNLKDGAVSLLYEDSAPPYDPLASAIAPEAEPLGTRESQAIGGLGLRLVRELSGDARYAYEEGRNRLWLTLRRR